MESINHQVEQNREKNIKETPMMLDSSKAGGPVGGLKVEPEETWDLRIFCAKRCSAS